MTNATIFFIIPTRYRIVTILETDIFRFLKNQRLKLVIFSPFTDDPEFRRQFKSKNIALEPLEQKVPRFFLNLILKLRLLMLKINNPQVEKSVKIGKNIKNQRIVGASVLNFFGKTFRKLIKPFSAALAGYFDKIEELILANPRYEENFKKYQPGAIVLGTWGSDINDLVFSAHARRHKRPSIIVDMPWSYIDNRLFYVPEKFTKIAVWNEFYKQELMKIHSLPAEHIAVTGSARYDFFVKNFKADPRADFFRKIGCDPKKKLITYALISDLWHPFQPEIIRKLMRTIKDNAFNYPVQLRVRLGPTQERLADYYELKKEFPELLIEDSRALPEKSYLANLLYWSDVALSVGSSLVLDSAILDKPHLYIGFSGLEGGHPYDSVLRSIYEFDFLKRAIETRGIKVVWSLEELINDVNDYLKNPEHNQEARKCLVKEFLGEADGMAGERIAKVILETAQ